MSSLGYTPEFNDEAVRQIVERNYSVTEVAERLGVSTRSLYAWIKAVEGSLDLQHISPAARGRKAALVRLTPLLSLLTRCGWSPNP